MSTAGAPESHNEEPVSSFLNQYGIKLIVFYTNMHTHVGMEMYKPYKDSFDKEWRIGFASSKMFGRRVGPGLRVTKEDCVKQLVEDLKPFAALVEHYVQMPLNDKRKGAILSYAHSVGIPAFKECRLLELINKRASKNDIIREWSPYINPIYRHKTPFLLQRRRAELNMFLAPDKEIPTLYKHKCKLKQCLLNVAECYNQTPNQIKAMEYLERKLVEWDQNGEVLRRFWRIWNTVPGGMDSPRNFLKLTDPKNPSTEAQG